MYKKALIIMLCVCMLLGFTGCKPVSKGKKSDIYTGYTDETDKLISLPALRQYGNYTCGTTCVQMLMNYLHPYTADVNLKDTEAALGTTQENGTSVSAIVNYFVSENVDIEYRQQISIKELVAYIDGGYPVMMCIQAWDESYNTDDPTNKETYLIAGHWVICVGYQKQADGYLFYFNDPACVGHCVMKEKELDARWIDMDAEGTVYEHFGIAVKTSSDYNGDGVFYLK